MSSSTFAHKNEILSNTYLSEAEEYWAETGLSALHSLPTANVNLGAAPLPLVKSVPQQNLATGRNEMAARREWLEATEQNLAEAQKIGNAEKVKIAHPTLSGEGVFLDYRNGWRICWGIKGKQPKRTLITEADPTGKAKQILDFARAYKVGAELYLASKAAVTAGCTFGAAAASFRAEIATGQTFSMKQVRRTRLARVLKPSLIDTTVEALDSLDSYWGDKPIKAISQDAITAYRTWLVAKFWSDKQARIAASTSGKDPDARFTEPGTERFFKRELLMLRVFDHAVRQSMIAAIDVPEIIVAERSKGVRGTIEDRNWLRLTTHLAPLLAGTDHGARTFAQFIQAAEACGLRAGALMLIQIGDLDFVHGQIFARPYKAHKGYLSCPNAAFFDVARAILASHPRRDDPTAPLFVKRGGEGYSMDSFQQRFQEVRTALNMFVDRDGGKIDLMSLRHRYVIGRLRSRVTPDIIGPNIGTSAAMIKAHYGAHILPAETMHGLLNTGFVREVPAIAAE